MSAPTIKRRTETVWLYQGDDREEIARLQQAVDDAQRPRTANLRYGGGDESAEARTAAVEAYNAFVAAARERAVKVVLSALGRRQWRALTAEHPPRDGDAHKDADSEAGGVNSDTFPDALLNAHDPNPTMVEPTFESVAERTGWLDELSDADYGRLYSTAYLINRASGSDPKELPVSAPTVRSSGS